MKSIGEIDIENSYRIALRIVQNPTENLTVATMLLAAVTLLLLLVIVSLLFLITPRRRKIVRVRTYNPSAVEASAADSKTDVEPSTDAMEEPGPDDTGDESPRPKKPRGPVAEAVLSALFWLGGPVGITILIVLALFGTYVSTSLDTYCSDSCHAGNESVKAAVRLEHAACIECHEQPGVSGAVDALAQRGRMAAVAAVKGTPVSSSAVVMPSACMRCHADIAKKTSVSDLGVRMSHKEVLSAGSTCDDCHPSTGHDSKRYVGGMSRCVICHDAVKASAECSTCHSTDPTSMKVRASKGATEAIAGGLTYPPVNAAKRDCAGCHDVAKSCDPCHGVRMPHSPEFIARGHARLAAFDGKKKCWKCHEPGEGCTGRSSCHMSMTDRTVNGHPPTWRLEHRKNPWDSGCGCHSVRRGMPSQRYCKVCH
jgi:hypothetical protein